MIKLYKDGQLKNTFKILKMKDMSSIEYIYMKIKPDLVEIPKHCEERMQYTLRENGFILRPY